MQVQQRFRFFLRLSLLAAFVLVTCPLITKIATAENWTQWRGSRGNSVSEEKNVPFAWSKKIGIAWTTNLPGAGNSTPAIWGDAVFVTTQKDSDLLLLRINKRDGKIVWKQKVGSGETPRNIPGRGRQKFHRLQNLASPSPVTNGKQVVVHFGNGDLAAYDFSGKQLWFRNLAKDHGTYSIWWGHANSPVLFGNLVISVCMQDPLDDLEDHKDKPAVSYLVAHDLQTGRMLWHTSRMTGAKGEQGDAYTTPLLRKGIDGWELIVMGGNQLDAYDVKTGKQRWFVPGLIGGRTVTGPTIAGDIVYATRGMRGSLLAFRLGGEGRRNKKESLWSSRSGTPDSCCPVVYNGLLFTISDDGVARCYTADKGQLKWSKRIGGNFKASPLAADGRIYFLDTKGQCTVIAALDRYDLLTQNRLDDETIASPAVSGGHLFIRARSRLYCIEN